MTGLSLASSGLARGGYVHGLFPFGAGRMVTDGAARSGRRTPEPHVWPAAPLQFMRGDGWRGAAMGENAGAWLRARREEMREEAETDGLSLHDALVYYGCDDLLWEVVHDELSPTDAGEREFGDFLRGELMRSLRERFIDGTLIAYAGDPKRPGYRIKIPREEWSVLEWRDTSSLSSYGVSLTDWLCRPVSRLGRFYGDAECYHNVTVKSADNHIISPVSVVQEQAANEIVASEPAVRQGTRGYDDNKPLEEMKAGLESGKYPNLWQAACACASKAKGSSVPQAKEKRLEKKFKEKYPKEAERFGVRQRRSRSS
ncbi:hypothetical protein [Gluconobacter cerinus]|uniref:hypothetical protein n=1 Tax=Gluconobacter cerinus TaxID=38307 RepID=UPI0020118B7A|nr:hypothetical protein [Gluconobacter cerinus]